MKRIGVIANTRKPHARDVVSRTLNAAEKHGMTILGDHETAALVNGIDAMDWEHLREAADVVIAMGGDGTMLRAVRELAGCDVPLMGVNIGSLGFLTSIAEDDIEKAVACLAAGDVVITQRVLATAVVLSDGADVGSYCALNDIVIRSGSPRVATLDVAVDGDHVTEYVCDGVIVSTPAGSTGYSLSAGGPILSPDTPAFVISLICPHTLSSRPLVVPNRSTISITAGDTGGALFLTADGQVGQAVEQGDCIRIHRCEHDATFVQLPGYSYFGVLRQKLGWRGSSTGPSVEGPSEFLDRRH